ncbi:MAG: acyl-CoA desaturase, partial [Betaproteobacteria bacterium]|nr:acyl-CoA desaturase [Betaproteobacteria bacterium]
GLLAQARAALPNTDTMVRMREELRQMWLNTHASRAQLALDLQQWCQRAEQSGVTALRDFSMQLRSAKV